MNIMLICSCGLLLDQEGQKLLIDGLTQKLPPFYRQPEAEIQKAIRGKGAYQGLCGLAFTHLHPDHYDEDLVRTLLEHQRIPVYRPDWAAPDHHRVKMGPFTIESYRFEHTPVPAQYEDVVHEVLLVSAGSKTVYVSADAQADGDKHRAILQGRTVDAAFWNSQQLSYPDMRAVMRDCARQNYIYHLPTERADVIGYRRKCEKNFQRFPQELQNVTALTTYPSLVSL